MAIYIRDEKTVQMVRELAYRLGVSPTEAVKIAVCNALARETRETPNPK